MKEPGLQRPGPVSGLSPNLKYMGDGFPVQPPFAVYTDVDEIGLAPEVELPG